MKEDKFELLERTALDDFELIYGDEEVQKASFMIKVNKALEFIKDKHKGQKRNITREDYINHPIRVFNILSALNVSNDVLIASLLHDILEDTKTDYVELNYKFGSEVADLVKECTKPYLDLDSKDALTIKFADMLDNVLDKPNKEWIKKRCNMIRGGNNGK